MIERIISGGQTGADQAGWRAAKLFGIPTGGWMAKGFMTEWGPKPEFAELYGAKECSIPGYPARTFANVRDSDLTCWFGSLKSSGYICTMNAAIKHGKPFIRRLPGYPRPELIEAFRAARVINIAGHRESTDPKIEAYTESFLSEVFRILGYKEIG